MTIDELLGLLDMQEEILQFSHFTNADAWEVGNCIVAEAIKRKLPVAVSIRLNNGLTVFQYASDRAAVMPSVTASGFCISPYVSYVLG